MSAQITAGTAFTVPESAKDDSALATKPIKPRGLASLMSSKETRRKLAPKSDIRARRPLRSRAKSMKVADESFDSDDPFDSDKSASSHKLVQPPPKRPRIRKTNKKVGPVPHLLRGIRIRSVSLDAPGAYAFNSNTPILSCGLEPYNPVDLIFDTSYNSNDTPMLKHNYAVISHSEYGPIGSMDIIQITRKDCHGQFQALMQNHSESLGRLATALFNNDGNLQKVLLQKFFGRDPTSRWMQKLHAENKFYRGSGCWDGELNANGRLMFIERIEIDQKVSASFGIRD